MADRDRWYKTAQKRLSKQKPAVVLDWADSAVWSLQAGLDGYRATYDEAALDEAHRGAVSLLAAVEVLLDKERAKGPE